MDNQTKEARKMTKELPLHKKIAHIWEYYRYKILGGFFVISVVFGTIYSIVTKPTYDMSIAYYTEQAVSQETIEELESFLTNYTEDYDGDGMVSVKVNLISLETLGETPEMRVASQNRLFAELATSSYPIFLVDGIFYDILMNDLASGSIESFRDTNASPLSEILPTDASQSYWCTRALYAQEEGKEEAVLEHERALKMELAIFGERE